MHVSPDDRFVPGKARRKRHVQYAWIWLGLIAAVGVVLLSVVLGRSAPAPHSSAPQPEAAAETPSVVSLATLRRLSTGARLLAERLAEERCNRTITFDLMVHLRQAAEYRAMISVEAASRAACGRDDGMLYPLLQAQLGSAELAGAARTADELVETFPTDPNVWGWRADLREKAGDFEAAVRDWHHAQARFPDPQTVALSVYYSTARAEARAGRPCDAVLTIRDFLIRLEYS